MSEYPLVPQPYTVQRVRRETHDIFTLELLPPKGSAPLPFAPGQFNLLYAFGTGEVPISISNDPDRALPLLHTIRAVGNVSNALRNCRPGSVVGIAGVYGNHWPLEMAVGRDVIIAAGGVGLAPLRAAVYQLLSQREKYGHIVILYGTRTPADILYRRELEQWRARFDVSVLVTVDNASADWRGNVGWISTLVPNASFEPAETVAFVCGPELMMRSIAWELIKRGVAEKRIFITMERNMKCAVGLCGHCQFGPFFVCKDGPIFAYHRVRKWLLIREL